MRATLRPHHIIGGIAGSIAARALAADALGRDAALLDTLIDAVRSGRGAHAAVLAAVVGYATERFHRGENAWPSGLITHEEVSGLMLGNAGIGHLYLRLADPSLNSLLAPAPRAGVVKCVASLASHDPDHML